MDPFLHVRLVLTSDDVLDPTVITRRLGIEPDQTWVMGTERVSPNGHVRPPWQTSGWRLSLYEQTVDLPAVLTRLVAMVEPLAEQLADLRRELNLEAEIGVSLKMADQAPAGTVDAALLKRLVALDVDLDLDLYSVDEDYVPIDAARYGAHSYEHPERLSIASHGPGGR